MCNPTRPNGKKAENYTYNLRAIKSNEDFAASVAQLEILSYTFGTVDINASTSLKRSIM